MKSLMQFLLGDRILRVVPASNSLICWQLFVDQKLNMDKVRYARSKYLEQNSPSSYTQEVGRIYGGKVIVTVEFGSE